MESLKHGAFLTTVVSSILDGLLISVITMVFAEEWKAWTPRLAQKLMRGAVRLLPPEKRERYSEEWAAHLADTPGFLTKVFVAFSFYRASFSISRQSDKTEASKVVAWDTKALGTVNLSKPRTVVRFKIEQLEGDKHRPKILVVDEERVIADTLALILTRSGYTARAAYSGEEGVAVARDFKPQAVITDVLMPGISGIETGIQVRSFLPDCKVWLFAGQTACREQVEQAIHAGHAFSVFNKPTEPSEILSQLSILKGPETDKSNKSHDEC